MAAVELSEIRKLSLAERIQLVEDIWDTVAEDADQSDTLPITPEQRQELDERLADADVYPGQGASWAEVKARLTRRE